MIKINVSNCQGIQEFLEMYTIYIDNKNYYSPPRYPIATADDQGWPCFHYTDVDSINQCDSTTVVIDCITEGIHVKKYFERFRTDRSYLIISNGWWCTSYWNLPFRYELVHYPYWLLNTANTYLSTYKFNYYSYKNYDFECLKSFNFVSTIGHTKPERSYLVEQIKSRLSYDNYVLRYSGRDYGAPGHTDIVQFENGGFDPYTTLLEKYYFSIVDSIPMDLYNQGNFILIAESNINFQQEYHLTEKTLKAIITGIPFVMIATPNFLRELRLMGFTTYNDLWDESYDSETDWKRRVDKVVDLCEHLQNFDWNGHKSTLREIQIKNRSNFFNLNGISSKMFEEFEHSLKKLDQ